MKKKGVFGWNAIGCCGSWGGDGAFAMFGTLLLFSDPTQFEITNAHSSFYELIPLLYYCCLLFHMAVRVALSSSRLVTEIWILCAFGGCFAFGTQK